MKLILVVAGILLSLPLLLHPVSGHASAAIAPTRPMHDTSFPSRAATRPMRISSLRVRPHTVSRHGTLTFTAQVSGMTLDLAHLGKQNLPRHGHLQYYLDRIPADAWRRVDLHHGYIDAVATSRFSMALSASPVPFRPGTHHILVALARNDRVLYHLPIRSLRIVVR